MWSWPILSININWDFIILHSCRNKPRLFSSLATVLYSHLNSDFKNLPCLWFSWLQEWPPLPSHVFLILRALVVLHNFTLGTWIFKCYLVSATFKKLFQMKNMFMNDKISFAWCDFFLKIKLPCFVPTIKCSSLVYNSLIPSAYLIHSSNYFN